MSFFNYLGDDSHLKKYIIKSIELKLGKNILSNKNNILQSKKKVLEEKRKELDTINFSVWDIEDKFCNDVWNFSLEHNFSSFFNQCPEISDINNLHECKYNKIINEDTAKANVYEENILSQLRHEIDILNNEILFIRNENVTKDLEYYKLTLDNLKSFSEEISELIRLITTAENSENIYYTAMSKNSNKFEGFVSAKKIVKKSNFHNRVLTEKKILSLSATFANGSKEPCKIKNNVKFGRFIMKKRSIISLKFEQNLQNSI